MPKELAYPQGCFYLLSLKCSNILGMDTQGFGSNINSQLDGGVDRSYYFMIFLYVLSLFLWLPAGFMNLVVLFFIFPDHPFDLVSFLFGTYGISVIVGIVSSLKLARSTTKSFPILVASRLPIIHILFYILSIVNKQSSSLQFLREVFSFKT